jgi:hypothetical protein
VLVALFQWCILAAGAVDAGPDRISVILFYDGQDAKKEVTIINISSDHGIESFYMFGEALDPKVRFAWGGEDALKRLSLVIDLEKRQLVTKETTVGQSVEILGRSGKSITDFKLLMNYHAARDLGKLAIVNTDEQRELLGADALKENDPLTTFAKIGELLKKLE